MKPENIYIHIQGTVDLEFWDGSGKINYGTSFLLAWLRHEAFNRELELVGNPRIQLVTDEGLLLEPRPITNPNDPLRLEDDRVLVRVSSYAQRWRDNNG